MLTRNKIIWLILAFVTVGLLAACGAQPAAQPAPVEVVVTKEVEKVVVQTVEVEKVVTQEVEKVVEVPAEVIKMRVAYPSTVDFEDIASLIAQARLADQGYSIIPTFYAQSELAVDALARGDADFGNGAERTFWAAAAKGAPIRSVVEQAANAWSIYAIPEIKTCADLQGMRLAQHSEGAVSKAMTDAYLQENCPGTEPNVLIIPGSENRAAALLAGEIDATPVELSDAVQIELQAPGRFHILTNFAKDVPKLKTTGIYVNTNFAQEHPEAVKDYIRALLTVHREIAENPDMLVQEASKWLPIEPETLQKIAQAYFDIKAFDPNGGLDEDSIQYSIDFYVKGGSMDAGATVDDVADLSYLNEVLDEIGRQ